MRAERKLLASCKADDSLLDVMSAWLDPGEVAQVLGGCSLESVRLLREKGAIEARDFRSPGAKVATFRFYRDSVRLYLASRPDPAKLLGV